MYQQSLCDEHCAGRLLTQLHVPAGNLELVCLSPHTEHRIAVVAGLTTAR